MLIAIIYLRQHQSPFFLIYQAAPRRDNNAYALSSLGFCLLIQSAYVFN
jgi:hypothetical protein